MEDEIWKDIDGYEGLYQISSFGRVKSIGNKFTRKDKFLKLMTKGAGYYYVDLWKNGKNISKKIHQLVVSHFLNYKLNDKKLVINHIDFNKKNNKSSNLEIITIRENTNQKHLKHSSIYTGVCWVKRDKRWYAQIWLDGKQKYLGSFIDEKKASESYETALRNHLKQKAHNEKE